MTSNSAALSLDATAVDRPGSLSEWRASRTRGLLSVLVAAESNHPILLRELVLLIAEYTLPTFAELLSLPDMRANCLDLIPAVTRNSDDTHDFKFSWQRITPLAAKKAAGARPSPLRAVVFRITSQFGRLAGDVPSPAVRAMHREQRARIVEHLQLLVSVARPVSPIVHRSRTVVGFSESFVKNSFLFLPADDEPNTHPLELTFTRQVELS